MTRRDYIEIAAALKRAHEAFTAPAILGALTFVANEIARYCAARDPKFDVARFLKNAGVS